MEKLNKYIGNECRIGNGKKIKGVTEMPQAILLKEYEQIVKIVQEILIKNPEWLKRYPNYVLDDKGVGNIRKMRKAFRVWKPMFSYLTISKTMQKGKAKSATFDLRYQGQSIADLVVSEKSSENNQGYEVALQISEGKAKTNLRDFGFSMAENASGKPVWSLKDAAKFRAHFKAEPVRTDAGNKKNREHQFESEILTDMRKKSAAGKILCNMQPVLLCGERFQMPTPLSASDARKDNIKYAEKGGGIDILARAGTCGANTNLCIIEVKDQNESKEPPQAAMKQAIAYTTFIWQLLRADAALGQKWWKMFGFSRDIPAQLTLFAVVAMPAKASDQKYPGAEIQLDQNDKIVLHYIDIDETSGKPISKTF